jgi:NNP family nitrate/nitrite transporter-like MFS transporter
MRHRGFLGRVPVGVLTDLYGAKRMFPLVSALTIIPVLLVVPARDSFVAMGDLGGFVPPLVMGAVCGAKSAYSIGFMLLSGLAGAGCVCAYGRMRDIGAERP